MSATLLGNKERANDIVVVPPLMVLLVKWETQRLNINL